MLDVQSTMAMWNRCDMRDWWHGGHTHGSRMRHAVAELPETLIWVTLTGSRDTALRTSLFGALGRHVSRTHVRRRACSPVRCKRVQGCVYVTLSFVFVRRAVTRV